MAKNNAARIESHPAKILIQRMLMRRGDPEYVAQGRALAIVEALLDTRMLIQRGKFLDFDHDRGIIQVGNVV